MFQVFQNQKPCSSYKIKNWKTDTFNTIEEASVFAYLWAYPFNLEEAQAQPVLEVNKDYDFGMSEVSIIMTIKKV